MGFFPDEPDLIGAGSLMIFKRRLSSSISARKEEEKERIDRSSFFGIDEDTKEKQINYKIEFRNTQHVLSPEDHFVQFVPIYVHREKKYGNEHVP